MLNKEKKDIELIYWAECLLFFKWFYQPYFFFTLAICIHWNSLAISQPVSVASSLWLPPSPVIIRTFASIPWENSQNALRRGPDITKQLAFWWGGGDVVTELISMGHEKISQQWRPAAGVSLWAGRWLQLQQQAAKSEWWPENGGTDLLRAVGVVTRNTVARKPCGQGVHAGYFPMHAAKIIQEWMTRKLRPSPSLKTSTPVIFQNWARF